MNDLISRKTVGVLTATVLVHTLFATTYYASPDGTGTGASTADPCSIVDGFSKIKSAAHTLVLAKGRYLLSDALSLPAVMSTTEQTVVMGETGDPADVVLDAQGNSEIMRLQYSCLVTGLTMINGSNTGYVGTSSKNHPASGVRISYAGNDYGPSVVSNCVIACCTNNYAKTYDDVKYCGAATLYANGLLVDSVVSNNVSLRYYCAGVDMRDGSVMRGCTVVDNTAVDGGAGVFVHDGASVLIADSLFTNNTASGSKSTGGGLDCRTAGSVLTVTNCTFAGNSACLGGGLDAVGDVEVSCVDCKFLGNTAKGHGGGLRLATTAKVRIDGCVFDGNNTTDEKYDGEADNAGGGGVFVQTQSGDGFVGISNSVFRDNITKSRGGGFGHTWKASVYGEVVNCRFIGNSSYRQGGGMVLREEAPRADRPFLIRNCLFAFNTSTCTSSSLDCSGAGLHFVSYGNPILDSCTIVANNSGQSKCSGGIHHRWGGTVTNCIVAFNTKAGTAETGTGWCLVDPNNTSVLLPSAYVNSCAWPAAEGAFLAANGCLNANPQFRDAAHGDFTLKAASPCRDAGVSESWMTGAVDLAGRQRVRGRYVDMGAYEYFPCGCLFMFW